MLYNNDNDIKIINFGLSRFNQENEEKTILGRKLYLSPTIYEQFLKKMVVIKKHSMILK